MIEERKKHEFWNYLTTERNQPRPKGITAQRLAVVKPVAINSDLWLDVIETPGAGARTAREFYGSSEAASTDSRAKFWAAIKAIIRQEETELNLDRRERTNVRRKNGGRKGTGFNTDRRK